MKRKLDSKINKMEEKQLKPLHEEQTDSHGHKIRASASSIQDMDLGKLLFFIFFFTSEFLASGCFL